MYRTITRGALEDAEDLLHVERLVHARLVREHVEPDRLRQGPALSHRDNVTFLDILEARRDVDRHVLMSLLETACVEWTVRNTGRITRRPARVAWCRRHRRASRGADAIDATAPAAQRVCVAPLSLSLVSEQLEDEKPRDAVYGMPVSVISPVLWAFQEF